MELIFPNSTAVIKIVRRNGSETEVEIKTVSFPKEDRYYHDVFVSARFHGREIGTLAGYTPDGCLMYVDAISVDEEFRDTDLGARMLKHLYENQSTVHQNSNAITLCGLVVNDLPEPVPDYVNEILLQAKALGVFEMPDAAMYHIFPKTTEVIKIIARNGAETEVEIKSMSFAREDTFDENVFVSARFQGREIGTLTGITIEGYYMYIEAISLDEEYRDTDLGARMLKHLYENQSTLATDGKIISIIGLLGLQDPNPPDYVKEILLQAKALGVFETVRRPHPNPHPNPPSP